MGSSHGEQGYQVSLKLRGEWKKPHSLSLGRIQKMMYQKVLVLQGFVV